MHSPLQRRKDAAQGSGKQDANSITAAASTARGTQAPRRAIAPVAISAAAAEEQVGASTDQQDSIGVASSMLDLDATLEPIPESLSKEQSLRDFSATAEAALHSGDGALHIAKAGVSSASAPPQRSQAAARAMPQTIEEAWELSANFTERASQHITSSRHALGTAKPAAAGPAARQPFQRVSADTQQSALQVQHSLEPAGSVPDVSERDTTAALYSDVSDDVASEEAPSAPDAHSGAADGAVQPATMQPEQQTQALASAGNMFERIRSVAGDHTRSPQEHDASNSNNVGIASRGSASLSLSSVGRSDSGEGLEADDDLDQLGASDRRSDSQEVDWNDAASNDVAQEPSAGSTDHKAALAAFMAGEQATVNPMAQPAVLRQRPTAESSSALAGVADGASGTKQAHTAGPGVKHQGDAASHVPASADAPPNNGGAPSERQGVLAVQLLLAELHTAHMFGGARDCSCRMQFQSKLSKALSHIERHCSLTDRMADLASVKHLIVIINITSFG